MKGKKRIFNIVAEFDLDNKPDWLDAFRKKYDRPYSYHVVFKYATYFDDADIESIKSDIIELTKKYDKIRIVFDKLLINDCIMIMAKENRELINIQKEIVEKFSKYGKSIKDKYADFDLDFEPHITIGRGLTPDQLENAKKDLREDFLCEVLIDKIYLTVINEDSFDEWTNPDRKTSYELLKE